MEHKVVVLEIGNGPTPSWRDPHLFPQGCRSFSWAEGWLLGPNFQSRKCYLRPFLVHDIYN